MNGKTSKLNSSLCLLHICPIVAGQLNVVGENTHKYSDWSHCKFITTNLRWSFVLLSKAIIPFTLLLFFFLQNFHTFFLFKFLDCSLDALACFLLLTCQAHFQLRDFLFSLPPAWSSLHLSVCSFTLFKTLLRHHYHLDLHRPFYIR